MKTKIFGFMMLLALSTQAAGHTGSPLFTSLTCQADIGKFQIKLQQTEQSNGTGIAVIDALGIKSDGVWNWNEAEEGTRLAGYYHLTVQAGAQGGFGPFYIHVLFSPEGGLSGGWLMMHRNSGSIECKIDKIEQAAHQCTIPPQNDCHISPKRLCCECYNGKRYCS